MDSILGGWLAGWGAAGTPPGDTTRLPGLCGKWETKPGSQAAESLHWAPEAYMGVWEPPLGHFCHDTVLERDHVETRGLPHPEIPEFLVL